MRGHGSAREMGDPKDGLVGGSHVLSDSIPQFIQCARLVREPRSLIGISRDGPAFFAAFKLAAFTVAGESSAWMESKPMSQDRSRCARCGRQGVLLLALLSLVLTGCSTVHYYQQAATGQWRIVRQRQPIRKLLVQPTTSAPLKQQFERVLEFREFAERDLRLPVNGHYLKYVELDRPYVVWNVHAAPEFSLEPKAWWYPVVGRLKYRGYFAEADARRYAARLERHGYDVFVDGVEAYSTLGWFKDPVLSTFLHHRDTDLAETLFHEIAHQRLFAAGDTDFNEAFATTVAEEGVRRWLQATDNAAAAGRYATHLRRNRQFVGLIMGARRQLETLYGIAGKQKARTSVEGEGTTEGVAEQRKQKEQILSQLRADYARLKAGWGGYSGYDEWMSQPLNNAQLNTVATYYHLVPAFQRMLTEEGGSLEKFYRRAAALAKLDKKSRHRRLASFLDGQ